eukprot:6376166-Pyramimonas_sp.AAC.1
MDTARYTKRSLSRSCIARTDGHCKTGRTGRREALFKREHRACAKTLNRHDALLRRCVDTRPHTQRPHTQSHIPAHP